ncbi:hypothetical protein C7212DRAFT_365280 [Tuber magnatum]|uniref:Uncharacterized protein n=1 Tax=Tuber magnatum TaxID=42249 RepID=A0A317SIT4_9PEZI|nr:hypothetical protein C7212DRAFT_365280 [Tuber magnatum]
MSGFPAPSSSKRRSGITNYLSGYSRSSRPPPLNTELADEETYKKVIKRNGSLVAALAELEKRKEALIEANERLQHENEALKTQVMVVEDTARELSGKLDAQTEELKKIQTQEYQKTRGVLRESHEAISSQFREIFRQCSDWAKDYFKIKMADFDIRKFPDFKKELEEVSWGSSDWGSKVHFKASHLVQAVLGNMICKRIFSSPFRGTPPEFYQQFQDMYEIKYSIDRAEAQRWRASSLRTFYSCKRWPLSGQYSHPLQAYKDQHAMDILRDIQAVLRPIIAVHYPNLADQEAQVQKEGLFSIVKCAKALSEKMGQQSSELQILSKSWFSNKDRLFTPDDGRMENRYGGEDYDSQTDLRVDLILSPGFLKYGNDNAENLDVWNVWTPAIVEIHDPARLLPPPPPRPPTASARTPPTFASGGPEELPGGRQQQVAALPGTVTKQEHNEDEEYVDEEYEDEEYEDEEYEDVQAVTDAPLLGAQWY